MKRTIRVIPWIFVGVFALWLLASLWPRPEKGFHTRDFGRLPVLLNGRIQPMDSVARNSLLQIRNRQSVRLEKGAMTATEWLLEVFTKPGLANDRKIFRIDNIELRDLLKVSNEEKYFSYNELAPQASELRREAQRIDKIEDQRRAPYEKQLMKLFHGIILFDRLKNSLQPENSEDFAAELEEFRTTILPGVAAVRARESGQSFDQEAFDKILEYVSQYDFLARMAYPLVVPPTRPGQGREEWENVGTSLLQAVRGGEPHPAVLQYAAMTSAYEKGDPAGFNRAVNEYSAWLSEEFPTEVRKGRWEAFYNRFEPFYKASIIYVLGFILACSFWFNLSPWLNRSAFGLVALALVVHTAGLIFRMVLEGRPPVTNLYSSAIFVGWGVVGLGLILERFYRLGIGTAVAAIGGFTTLVIAHNLALGGDTMEMLRAVLDTNFWLATHVVVITLGYSATFVAGLLAVLFILLGVFTKVLQPNVAKALSRMVYGVICFATLFSFVGTILGGIWADQSWGRFWGWDPKENGALMIVLWNAVFLHARWGRLLKERGLMGMAVFGNVVTSFSWFGVNMLGVGLHSYGFMDQAFKWLMAFVLSQLVIIGIGMLPMSVWKSFRGPPPPSPEVPLGRRAPAT